MAMLAAAVAAPVVGGIVGNIMGAKDRAAAQAAMAQAYAQLEAIGVPPDLSQALIYKEFQSAGVLTPELESDIQLGKSQVEQIKTDGSTRDAQMTALNKMLQTGQQGLTSVDRAALNEAQGQALKAAEGQRQGVIQNMAQRGMGGSGAELIAMLGAGQQADQLNSDAALKQSAQSQMAALQAMSQAGQLGGQVRSSDFSEANTKASAADTIAQWNAQNQTAQQMRNIAAKNTAQGANLQAAQSLGNSNTSMYNQELNRQNEAKRTNWLDQLNLAQAKAQALTGQAQNYRNQAQQTQQMYTGIGAGVGQGVAGYQQGQASDRQNDLYEARTDAMNGNNSGVNPNKAVQARTPYTNYDNLTDQYRT
jgi:hypothetical protein